MKVSSYTYARWKEAEEFISKHGTIVKIPSGYWQQVPQVSIAQIYLKIMQLALSTT
ncbi:Phage terminase small subunit [Sporomusa ovata]|uniref:Phage terminase small subunit n=1 Tax=Sporomusa ovata TaxID=2378 RepID=A0A0U1L2B8_9FIRM|nr:Phage terminase small subunit [Sporomusa ovata]